MRLFNGIYVLKEEARRQSTTENETKIENAQLKSEHVAATDKVQQLQKEMMRLEAEKAEGASKIQIMQNEMKDLNDIGFKFYVESDPLDIVIDLANKVLQRGP